MHIVTTTNTADARIRKLHGTVFAHSLKHADGLDSTHKENIDKHGKSGDYENLITALLPSRPFMLAHNSASPELFFHITCFNEA